MSNWDYIQSLLDIIDKQAEIIKYQAELLAMNEISTTDETSG